MLPKKSLPCPHIQVELNEEPPIHEGVQRIASATIRSTRNVLDR